MCNGPNKKKKNLLKILAKIVSFFYQVDLYRA